MTINPRKTAFIPVISHNIQQTIVRIDLKWLTQGWMKYGAALKNLQITFSETVFLIEKLRESSRLTELAKQISKTQPKIVEITPREGVCRRLESDMQI